MPTPSKRWISIVTAFLLITPAAITAAQEGDSLEPADLEVADIERTPEEPTPGENVTFSAVIENGGETNASAFNVTFYVDGEEHDTVRVDGLGADDEVEVESAPWNASLGEHTIEVLVDSSDEIEESDEENNARADDLEIEARDEDEGEDEDDEVDDDEAELDDHDEERGRERGHGPPEHAREKRREAGSQWTGSDGTFEGRYISFDLNESLPGLLDYAYGDDVLFTQISLTEGDKLEWQAHGRSFTLESGESELKALDNPNGLLIVEAEDGNVTLLLADGVNATQIEDGGDDERDVYKLSFGDNETAWFAGEELALDNATFTLGEKAHLRVHHAGGSPNKGPGSLPDAARSDDDDDDGEDRERGPPEHARGRSEAKAANAQDRGRIEQAITAGAVGVEVHSDADEGEPVAFELGHVSVKQAKVNKSDDKKASIQIEAEDGSPGTTVVLNLDAEDLGNLTVAQAAEQLEIRFDNETIAAADDLEDALDWSNDDGEAEYLLLVGSDKVQVLVSVPHFSPHTIDVYSAQTQSSGEHVEQNDTPFPAVLGLVAVALAAAALVRRND